MSRTPYYTATSLDGFIATPDHSLDWLFTRQKDQNGPMNYAEFSRAWARWRWDRQRRVDRRRRGPRRSCG
jgi:hypothetical protein